MKKLIRNRLFSKRPAKYWKERKAISYQKRMEAYRRSNAAMTDVMLLMYARNLYR
jgi:hypothetical protein